LVEGSGQRPGTPGIFGVGLHSAQQRGDCLARHLFSGGLINSELRGKLIHRNFGQYVIYSTHHWAFLPAAEKQRPGSRQTGDLVATHCSDGPARDYCGRPDIRQARGPGWMGLRSDRQYADQPDRAGIGSPPRCAVNCVVSTVTTAASSSSVGEPLTTVNATS
jgi:hypothetical protein